ncbi:MAG TPA: tRNA (adenosine(37)-N6)-threonylcarbamoyltransferase complex ATPase subunit type 1 TsaE [Burkholderiales bacterium]|nr:tRNA (adenosine(37)-N6)-threonylcarbamoyltransferase complex ATPase subunit type 1 TsaE [Burkholderiales bacterium]
MHKPHHNQPDTKIIRHLADEQATRALGVQLAPLITPGLKVYFCGELGSGKTTLVRGLLEGLGYRGKVKSPTYLLVELYAISRLDLYHFDFYRFKLAEEWQDAGFREHFDSQAVCLVEWPEKAAGLLPVPDIKISLQIESAGRAVTIEGVTETGRECLKLLQDT